MKMISFISFAVYALIRLMIFLFGFSLSSFQEIILAAFFVILPFLISLSAYFFMDRRQLIFYNLRSCLINEYGFDFLSIPNHCIIDMVEDIYSTVNGTNDSVRAYMERYEKKMKSPHSNPTQYYIKVKARSLYRSVISSHSILSRNPPSPADKDFLNFMLNEHKITIEELLKIKFFKYVHHDPTKEF